MAKFCGNCGAKLDDNARVCGHCGTPVGGAPTNMSGAVTQMSTTSKKASNTIKQGFLLVVAIIIVLFAIRIISGVIGGNSIVGTWTSDDGMFLTFNEDGTYTASYMYGSSSYAIKDDDTLILNTSILSTGRSGSYSYERVANKEEAEMDESYVYYLSNNTLIINGETLTRTK